MLRRLNVAPVSHHQNGARGKWTTTTTSMEAWSGTLPELSVVVPTRNEAGNIEELVSRLENSLPDTRLEVIFIDDSDDETVAAIESVGAESSSDVVVIHREAGERLNGLGGAVVEGLRAARAPWVCVMDADLQHPPEIVPQLLNKARQTGASLVVASRYAAQGNTGDFSKVRQSISHTSTLAARTFFPSKLRGVSDPLSGFFLVSRAAIDPDKLKPRGFKILLEVLVRTPCLQVAEVGFQFGTRYAGKSKASMREGMRYLSHLFALRFSERMLRFALFLIVGLSGLVVNTLLLAGATETLGLYYLLSAVIATQGSTLWNFVLTETWVFSDRKQREGRGRRLAAFYVMNNIALALRGPLLFILTTNLGVHYVLSNIISLVILMLLRYGLADNIIWRRTDGMAMQNNAFAYDVHGILTVTSDVWLPELERFLVEDHIADPTIRVRIGKVGKAEQAAVENGGDGRRICYQEGLGPLGFGMDVTMGDTIEVVATPLLQQSPHVLYTNIVEPILRWTFVGKGYALVHGACLIMDKGAYLVTARTDTGKTTTMLRILDRQRRASDRTAFLSDDLILVAPDGTVLAYPKPLTVSHHTVRAINCKLLSRKERFKLIYQSRIHSKSGRLIAHFLAKKNLPVATFNTLVQFVVPPPKFQVNRLIPNVKIAREGTLAGMFVIQRGQQEIVHLGEQEALETLMSNCEDAFGFPPYSTIETFLHSSNGKDLRTVEHEIVASALQGKPTTLLGSSKMDWSETISNMMHINLKREEVLTEIIEVPALQYSAENIA